MGHPRNACLRDSIPYTILPAWPPSPCCHQDLGTLHAKIGQPAQARTELLAAIVLYRELEMTFRLSQAEAALTQVMGM